MKLTMSAGRGDLASIDIGEPSGRYMEGGELDAYGGNLYLYIDGKEFGSLFFHVRDGKPAIMLGQFDFNTEEWEERSDITAIPDDFQPTTKEDQTA